MKYNKEIPSVFQDTVMGGEPVTANLVSQMLLETTKQFFMNSDNFLLSNLRKRDPSLLWDADVTKTQVRILRDVDWIPENMGKTPEIVISNGGTSWRRMQVGSNIRVDMRTHEGVCADVASRWILWCISPVAEEAWDLAFELGCFYSAFYRNLIEEYYLTDLKVVEIANPSWIDERKGYWGVPVALEVAWSINQGIIEGRTPLAEVKLTINH